ncbi:hypothetical protein A1Q2_04352 [Trichosporon asahii var. asahii CBS 8904]|uniref:Chaperonin GroES n=1 Tax=Trichosporon asahii var. asahii (strain CBS 8904) TaxID=1220162 RepID=K1WIW3_TRIAC|nr:hypothetical protein A1Q2_04352 [Trichosporon asahii var. asahii CBS 8904]
MAATFKNIKSLQPLFDRVLVQRFKPETDTRGDPPLASKPSQRFVLLRTLTKLLAWFLRFSFSCSLSCPNAPLELFGHDIRRKAEKAEKPRRSVGRDLSLRLLVGSVVLRRKTASGIFLPSSAASTPLPEATVIAVGPGAPGKDGKVVPTSVQAGDRVLLPGWGGSSIKVGEEVSYQSCLPSFPAVSARAYVLVLVLEQSRLLRLSFHSAISLT